MRKAKMYNRICGWCKKSYVVTSKLKNTNVLFCSRPCYVESRKGVPRKPFRMSWGYKYILAKSHPYCSKQGYVAEHRIVCEKHLGRLLQPHEVVHHLNGDKTDNRYENLVVCSRIEHNKHHNTELVERNKLRAKPVAQVNTRGETVKVWRSITEAAMGVGVSTTAISNAVKLSRNSAGFRWVLYR